VCVLVGEGRGEGRGGGRPLQVLVLHPTDVVGEGRGSSSEASKPNGTTTGEGAAIAAMSMKAVQKSGGLGCNPRGRTNRGGWKGAGESVQCIKKKKQSEKESLEKRSSNTLHKQVLQRHAHWPAVSCHQQASLYTA
jgi:hypothetical protein